MGFALNPSLAGIAWLCCDARRQIRMQALTYLQRALLVHDLQALDALEWESCFNKVTTCLAWPCEQGSVVMKSKAVCRRLVLLQHCLLEKLVHCDQQIVSCSGPVKSSSLLRLLTGPFGLLK